MLKNWSFRKNIVKPICIMMYTYVIEVGKRFNDSKLSTAMHNDITVILNKKNTR